VSSYRPGVCIRVQPNGTRSWYLDGQLHNSRGPAVELPDGNFKYFEYGVEVFPKNNKEVAPTPLKEPLTALQLAEKRQQEIIDSYADKPRFIPKPTAPAEKVPFLDWKAKRDLLTAKEKLKKAEELETTRAVPGLDRLLEKFLRARKFRSKK